MTEISPKTAGDTVESSISFSDPNHVLVASDFSDASKDMIRWVLEHLLKTGLSEEQQKLHIYSALVEPVIVDPGWCQ